MKYEGCPVFCPGYPAHVTALSPVCGQHNRGGEKTPFYAFVVILDIAHALTGQEAWESC